MCSSFMMNTDRQLLDKLRDQELETEFVNVPVPDYRLSDIKMEYHVEVKAEPDEINDIDIKSESVREPDHNFESEHIDIKTTTVLKIEIESESENSDDQDHYGDDTHKEFTEQQNGNVIENNADTVAEKRQQMEDGEYYEDTSVNQAGNATEYLEVQLMEDDDEDLSAQEISSNTKLSKKKKGDLTYKKYTKEDMEKCVYAVRNNVMSRAEAARFYKIPVKTLGNRLRKEAMKITNPEISEEDRRQLKHKKFLEEIKTILTYTNSTPYRSKAGRYNCFYCSEKELFDNPDDLRTHTRTKHVSERKSSVEEFMKPTWRNEIIKLDIENLNCIICSTPIESWNDTFKHLKEKHDVVLEEAHTRVIPFKLTEELTCALCSDKYLNYPNLDSHMNTHYKSYKCGECGEAFLSENRLRRHSENHKLGQFPCTHCEKVFTLDKYRKKHIDGVHGKEAKVKCQYCAERFRGEYARHLHQLKVHPEKIKTIKCEHCSKIFDWGPYYVKHKRLNHNNKKEKKHKCTMCNKQFAMRYELKNHEDWHKGVTNVCKVCGKNFCTKPYLQKHYKIHMAE